MLNVTRASCMPIRDRFSGSRADKTGASEVVGYKQIRFLTPVFCSIFTWAAASDLESISIIAVSSVAFDR
jgi:hypothetical protein